MELDIGELKERLNANPDFSSSCRYFDGIVLLEIGDRTVWMKVFMGEVVAASPTPFPFGYTFALKGDCAGWRFALDQAKNRLREAVYTKRLKVEGNTIEYSRLTRAAHGLTEVLRRMLAEGRLSLEERA